MAVSHLIEQGCRRIVHCGGPLNVSIYANRFKGYKAALEDHGIAFDESWHIPLTLTREKSIEAVEKLLQLKPVPDAIFSASDYSASGAIMALKERNIRIPEDIAIVGFANEPYAEITSPSLSSVDQHSREVGQAVARLFLEEIELHGPYISKSILLTPDLIVRGSSKKLK
ncbi:MAG TPA: substrate-binding domain-containing protein [Bacteroidales bacterium]|nr:substrate-binding domain-containing protein [Bacteroidales bacterium]